MPEIDTTPQTVKAIYQHYEDTNGDWRRPHLGASLIGHQCKRYLWYTFRWCAAPSFDGRMLRLFETGNREEERIVRNLRDVGVEVYDRDPKDNTKQIHYSDPECGGHFSGSLDAMARGFEEAPKAWHVCEFKTSNAKQFENLKRKGVYEAKPMHYAQMQMYMSWSKQDRAYYFCVCKDTDEIYGERIQYKNDIAYALREKAKDVIFAPEPPERCNGAKPDGWNCKYCQYVDICFNGELPEVNCRTCAHSTPVIMDGNARWDCNLRKTLLTTLEQKDEYCNYHIYIPALVPIDVADVDAENGTITYADGTVNGPGRVSSREMRCRYNKIL